MFNVMTREQSRNSHHNQIGNGCDTKRSGAMRLRGRGGVGEWKMMKPTPVETPLFGSINDDCPLLIMAH